jgi:hypothetical protein
MASFVYLHVTHDEVNALHEAQIFFGRRYSIDSLRITARFNVTRKFFYYIHMGSPLGTNLVPLKSHSKRHIGSPLGINWFPLSHTRDVTWANHWAPMWFPLSHPRDVTWAHHWALMWSPLSHPRDLAHCFSRPSLPSLLRFGLFSSGMLLGVRTSPFCDDTQQRIIFCY